MAVPNVQIAVNGDKIQAFWDLNLDGTYGSWNLYWDDESGWPDEAIIVGAIPNVVDAYYSKHYVMVTFDRPVLGTVPVYLRLRGISPAGMLDAAPSTTKYVPRLDEIDPTIRQKGYGWDPDFGIWRPIKVEKDTDPSIAGVLDVSP